MRVTILEQRYAGGHFLHYVARLIRALEGVADEIVLATPQACAASSQYGVYLRPLEDRFRTHPVWERWTQHNKPVHRLAFIYADLLKGVIRDTRCDAILVPGADGLAEATGLARLALRNAIPKSVHAEALIIRGPIAYGFDQRRRTAFLQKLAMRAMPFDRVHFIDPVVYRWARSLSTGLANRCRFVPDPIDPPSTIDKREARQQLGWPTNARIALSIGPQDDRKGTDVLVNATARAKLGPDDRIVLAGQIVKPLRAQIDAMMDADPTLRSRLILVDRYLSTDEFGAAMRAADLIVAPYKPQPHPSGVTLQAAAAGRMVLTSHVGWFEHIVPVFGLGMTCDCQSVHALAEALPVAIERSTTFETCQASRKLLAFHQPESFARAWRAGLLERLGRTPDADVPDWDALVRSVTSEASPEVGHGR
jgi:hypothetical protein